MNISPVSFGAKCYFNRSIPTDNEGNTAQVVKFEMEPQDNWDNFKDFGYINAKGVGAFFVPQGNDVGDKFQKMCEDLNETTKKVNAEFLKTQHEYEEAGGENFVDKLQQHRSSIKYYEDKRDFGALEYYKKEAPFAKFFEYALALGESLMSAHNWYRVVTLNDNVVDIIPGDNAMENLQDGAHSEFWNCALDKQA